MMSVFVYYLNVTFTEKALLVHHDYSNLNLYPNRVKCKQNKNELRRKFTPKLIIL